jgi:hypothetical protein
VRKVLVEKLIVPLPCCPALQRASHLSLDSACMMVLNSGICFCFCLFALSIDVILWNGGQGKSIIRASYQKLIGYYHNIKFYAIFISALHVHIIFYLTFIMLPDIFV